MNRDRAKELLPIIEAFANGVDIELYTDGKWTHVGPNPVWASPNEYRIKPKPRGEKNVELEASTAAMQPIIDAAIDFVVAENMDALGPYVAQRRRTLNALHDEVGKYLEKDL